MKTLKCSFVFLLLLSNYLNAQIYKDTVLVDNPESFLASIQSDRLLLISMDHIQLPDEELVFEDIRNLKIISSLTNGTRVTTSSTSHSVLTFKKGTNIHLENLSIGHWPEEGYCEGNVLDIFNSDSIFIDRCDLFGSGVIGLYLRDAKVWCSNTTIRECSDDIIGMDYRSSSLNFDNCNFYLNENNEFNYPEPRFNNCNFFKPDSTNIIKGYSGFYPKEPLMIKAELSAPYPGWSEQLGEEGELETVCPNTFSIETSSHLQAYKNITYTSQNLSQLPQDTDQVAAWVEGADGDGIGERIIFKVKSLVADFEPWGLSGEFRIINGYAKDQRTWENNGRIKKLKVSRNNRIVAYVDLIDSPNPQTFDLWQISSQNHLTIGEVLAFEIVEVYKGKKYSDTAITYLSACCAP